MTRNNNVYPAWLTESPKCVLHSHLEGSMTAGLRKRIATRRSSSPVEDSQFLKNLDLSGDWNNFRTVFSHFCTYLCTSADFKVAIEDYAVRLATRNVRYAEIMVSPWKHLSRGLTFAQLTNGLIQGAESSAEAGVSITFLCDITRKANEPIDAIITWFRKLPRSYFVGISFSGGSGSLPRSYYVQLGRLLSQWRIPVTAHGGELEGPRSIVECIEYLGARRIGHGVRALEDDKVLSRLLGEGIHLEVCPTANKRMRIGLPDHESVRALAGTGISFSINPDDEGIFDTNVQSEFALLYENQIMSAALLEKCSTAAISAAFCSDVQKTQLRARHLRYWTHKRF